MDLRWPRVYRRSNVGLVCNVKKCFSKVGQTRVGRSTCRTTCFVTHLASMEAVFASSASAIVPPCFRALYALIHARFSHIASTTCLSGGLSLGFGTFVNTLDVNFIFSGRVPWRSKLWMCIVGTCAVMVFDCELLEVGVTQLHKRGSFEWFSLKYYNNMCFYF